MPQYKNLEQLPESVQENLPRHGQEIYMAAFNSAWEQYADSEDRYEGRSQEETAHAVAWSAVQNVYEKDEEGNWVEKPEHSGNDSMT